MPSIGSVAGRLEGAFAGVWSLGELALALARPGEVYRDPHVEAVRSHVAAHGFHPPFDPGALDLTLGRSGTIRGTNPYVRVGHGPRDRVLGKLRRRDPSAPSRHLVVVCHCYGIPSEVLMRRLFGLGGIDADVVLNVMGNHQPGTFPLWPGSGMVSARMSRFVENVRSAVTGVRALVAWLRARNDYATVSAIGFSIGGQLALHLAHAGDVDRALLYCPVTSLRRTAKELGLMRHLVPVIDPTLTRLHGAGLDDLLALADPLSMPLPIAEERLHVVLHRHDALTPPSQIEPIRQRYPRVGWTELEGTHLMPVGLGALHRVVRHALAT
jgi:hypothetical protein